MRIKQKGIIWSLFTNFLALSLVIYGMQPIFAFAQAAAQAGAPNNNAVDSFGVFEFGQSAQQNVDKFGQQARTAAQIILSAPIIKSGELFLPELQFTYSSLSAGTDSAAENFAQQTYKLDPNLDAGNAKIIVGSQEAITRQFQSQNSQLILKVNNFISLQRIFVQRKSALNAYVLESSASTQSTPFTANTRTEVFIKLNEIILAAISILYASALLRLKSEKIGLNQFEILRC